MYDKKEEGEAREMAQTHKKKLPWKRKREREREEKKAVWGTGKSRSWQGYLGVCVPSSLWKGTACLNVNTAWGSGDVHGIRYAARRYERDPEWHAAAGSFTSVDVINTAATTERSQADEEQLNFIRDVRFASVNVTVKKKISDVSLGSKPSHLTFQVITDKLWTIFHRSQCFEVPVTATADGLNFKLR